MAFERELENLRRAQGRLPAEAEMLSAAFVGPPRPVSSPGANSTKQLALDNGSEVFHKSMAEGEISRTATVR
jgi:hypothetical protein